MSKKEIKTEDLFNSMLTAIATNIRGNNEMGIVEFAEDIVFNGTPEYKLYPTQKALLKAFYNEPLLPTEKEILGIWSEDNKSTWIEGRKYINLICEAGRRASKALAIDTPILTSKGWKGMGDIEKGDYVYSEKGLPTKVINTSPIFYDKRCLEVFFFDGSSIICDEQHLWYTETINLGEYVGSVKTTKEIKDTLYKDKTSSILNHIIPLGEELKQFKKSLNKNSLQQTIIKIEPVESRPVRCIQVENSSHLYLAGENLIPTHNSTMASIIALYEFYNLITLESPAKKYGLLPNSPLAIFVIAQSLDQVKETLFAAIKGYTENSLYFQGLVDSGTISIFAEKIICSKKNIGIYAKHTNSKALVGYTVKCLILDEASRFQASPETGVNGAFEVWDNVGRANANFKGEGRKVAISSAWEYKDPIEILYERTANDPHSLGFKLTTFDLNPTMKKGVTPSIVSDYIQDPIKSRLEYEGIRHNKQNAFFNKENVEKACLGISCLDAQPIDIDTSVNGDIRYYTGNEILRLKKLDLIDKKVSFIHVDPALKKDSAALAIASSTQLEDGTWGIQIDGVLKWEPHVDINGKKRVVSFIDVEEKIRLLSKARNVQLVTFDSWNSESFIQRLHTEGITTEQISSSREKQLMYYTLLRDLLSKGSVILPRDSIWTPDLKAELTELIMKPNKQIVHPYAGKDLADAICLSVYNCYKYQVTSGLILGVGSSNISTVHSNTLSSLKLTSSANTSNLDIGQAIKKLHRLRSPR